MPYAAHTYTYFFTFNKKELVLALVSLKSQQNLCSIIFVWMGVTVWMGCADFKETKASIKSFLVPSKKQRGICMESPEFWALLPAFLIQLA